MNLFKRRLVSSSKLGIFGFSGVLLLIALSNSGVFNPNWPFELFASFMRQVMVVCVFVLALCLFVWRRALPVLMALAVLAFWPLATFSKFQEPSGEPCVSEGCFSVNFVNLGKRWNVLQNLAAVTPNYAPDVLAVAELPDNVTETLLREMFPQYEYVFVATYLPSGEQVGSGLAILSHYNLSNRTAVAVPKVKARFWDRVFLQATIDIPAHAPVRMVVAHPRYPMSTAGARQRALMMDMAKEAIGEDDNFILVGDFNTTPWMPAFQKLPGKRAGDPRLISTWDAERPWLALPIDHVMVGAGIDVIESKVLPPIGSDHFPIGATLRTNKIADE